MEFRNDGDAFDVLAGDQGTEHPDELVDRFGRIFLVIGNGGKQPFHERLIRQAYQAELAGDAQLAGLHVGKDGNDLVARA